MSSGYPSWAALREGPCRLGREEVRKIEEEWEGIPPIQDRSPWYRVQRTPFYRVLTRIALLGGSRRELGCPGKWETFLGDASGFWAELLKKIYQEDASLPWPSMECSLHWPSLHSSDERLTAEEMDEQRRQNVAYQYLCRLEEAKRWAEGLPLSGLPFLPCPPQAPGPKANAKGQESILWERESCSSIFFKKDFIFFREVLGSQ